MAKVVQKKSRKEGSEKEAGDIRVQVKLEEADQTAGRLSYPLPALVA